MNISTKSEYALRALIYLANHPSVIPISEIAATQGISSDYLEKILAKLKKKNIVKVEKGATGGFKLGKDPRDIKMSDIVLTLESSKLPVCFKNNQECNKSVDCNAKLIWKKLHFKWVQALKSLTLADALD